MEYNNVFVFHGIKITRVDYLLAAVPDAPLLDDDDMDQYEYLYWSEKKQQWRPAFFHKPVTPEGQLYGWDLLMELRFGGFLVEE